MDIQKRNVTIKGTKPLLMHQYPLQPEAGLAKKPPKAQAEAAAYRDPSSGELFIPGSAIQRAVIGGANFVKKGLGRLVAACLEVAPEYLLLGTKVYEIDTRWAVIKGARIKRHRPRLDHWSVSFTLEWDGELITEAQIVDSLNQTGILVGLLDFRPACKGPFGRFMVTEFNEV